MGTARWIVCLTALVACRATAPTETPSRDGFLLTNARVYTLAWDDPAPDGQPASNAPVSAGRWRPDAEAVWVRDGRIAFVGGAAEARARAGERVRVIDLGGATVVPGLIESHTHVRELGWNLTQVSLVGVETEAEAVARVAAAARSVPRGEWILGYGWDEGAWADRYPTAERLSRAVPDHPVVLKGLHSFAVWGNRLALERAGITARTEAPTGGEIVRGDDGRPAGILLNRATPLLTGAVPEPSAAARAAALRVGLEALARAGYVGVHEAGVDAATLAAFEALAVERALPVHCRVMLSVRDGDLARAWLARGPRTEPRGRLAVRTVKAFYDGALGSRGAHLLDDYADRPGHRGIAGEGYQFDRDLVAALMKAGFQAAVHAIGDAANRETLDFFERVEAEAPTVREGRHRIEHAQVVAAEDFARFAALDVIASMEPPHAVEDMAWAEARLGAERVRGAYAWRSLRRAGARLIFNSDLPGSDHDFFYGLHAAVTRRDKQLEPTGGWYPEQCVTVEEALRAYTTWAAYAAFEEHVAGVIRDGYRADLTVLDIDPFAVAVSDPDGLLDGRVLMTIVEGEVVFDGRGE